LGALLGALTPVFEQGTFKAPKIDRVIPLSEGPTGDEQAPEAKRGAAWSWRCEAASATQKGIRTKLLKLLNSGLEKQVIAGGEDGSATISGIGGV
jgi:hypothetical protein